MRMKKKTRDMSWRYFLDALNRHGLKFVRGQYIGREGTKKIVLRFKGGDTFRAQLAYLLREFGI